MKPAQHVIASVSIGVIVWFFTKSIYAALLYFASGLFLDSDHIIEYIIHHGWEKISFKKVYRASIETGRQEGSYRFKRLYLVFHAGEIALILWGIAIYLKNVYFLAITLGYSSHLIMDCIGNPLYPQAYSILWRAMNKFNTDKFVRRQKDGNL